MLINRVQNVIVIVEFVIKKIRTVLIMKIIIIDTIFLKETVIKYFKNPHK